MFLVFIMMLVVCVLYLLCRHLFVSCIYFVNCFVKHTGSCMFLVFIMWTAVYSMCFHYLNCFVFLEEICKRTTVRICYSLCGPIYAFDIYNMFLKGYPFGSKDWPKELKLECAYFLGQTS